MHFPVLHFGLSGGAAGGQSGSSYAYYMYMCPITQLIKHKTAGQRDPRNMGKEGEQIKSTGTCVGYSNWK